MHLPEGALRSGRFGGFGSEPRLRMYVGQREMPDVSQVADLSEKLADGRLGLPAVGALEVAVLDQRHGCVGRSADVVSLRVDRLDEVDDDARRAEQQAKLCQVRQLRGTDEDGAGERCCEHRRGQDAELSPRPARCRARQARRSAVTL